MTTKLYFHFFGKRHNPWEGSAYAAKTGELVKESSVYSVVNTPQAADIIVLVESNLFKPQSYLEEILSNPLIRERAADCYCINYEPEALGIFPGLYAGLPRRRFETDRHIATCYLKPPDETDLRRATWLKAQSLRKPKHLLSFRGAMSHPVRKKLMLMAPELADLGPVLHVDRWFDHSENEKVSYWQEILDTQFVLCPRGISPASIRLFEVMEMGRVPVIIADEWVPPEGPNWDSFSLRIPENGLETMIEIIKSHESEWESMAAKARETWERYFSYEKKLPYALNQLMQKLVVNRTERQNSWKELLAYKGWRRQHQLGWTIPQRILRKIRKL